MIDRREFLSRSKRAILASGAVLTVPRFSVAAVDKPPLDIGFGPQLFLDDYIIESINGLKHVVQPPQRRPQPVLDSKTFGTTQPYMTVERDAKKNHYRIWYNNRPPFGGGIE